MEQSDRTIILIFGIAAIIGAIIALFITIRGKIKSKQNCTVLVQAKCTKLQEYVPDDPASLDSIEGPVNISDNISVYDETKKYYSPVFEINYNGKTYELTDDSYTTEITVAVGAVKNIYINPNNPYEFRDEANSGHSLGKTISIAMALIIGLAFIFMYLYGDGEGSQETPTAVQVILVLIFFIIPGLFIATLPIKNNAKKKRRCNVAVNAVCSRIDDQGTGGSKRPIYEITVNGEKQEITREYFSNSLSIKVGDAREIYINPNNPADYYDPKEKGASIFLVVFGSIFVAAGVYIIFQIV